jgi:putative endonuclease
MSLSIGNKYEKLALRHLQRQGLKLIQTNFRSKLGEIDLIMQDDNQIVFVEVRYRSQLHYGNSLETVNLNKQQKIIRTALFYLNERTEMQSCRFDVIAFSPNQQVKWIKNAFS